MHILQCCVFHYSDVMMSVMASQVTVDPMVCTTVCSGADERKHQSSASLAFVQGIHRSRENVSIWWRYHVIPLFYQSSVILLTIIKQIRHIALKEWFTTLVLCCCELVFSVICQILFYPFVKSLFITHDDVIKWKHFPRYWPFVGEIHRSPMNSPNKGQWSGALTFSLICAWINGWVNNPEAGDLRRYRAHSDSTVMCK